MFLPIQIIQRFQMIRKYPYFRMIQKFLLN